MSRTATEPPSRVLARARPTAALTFFLNGLTFATWASRIPDIRATLHLSNPHMGLLLLAVSGGAVVALPTTGAVVHRIGTRATIRGAALLVSAMNVLLTVTIDGLGSVRLTAAALVAVGLGISTWDVAMNLEGAEVERRLGRSLMPRLHAGFSLGSVSGALIGAVASHLTADITVHLATTALLVALVAVITADGFLDARPEHRGGAGTARAWRERRTLLVGVVVLAMALTEGVANDWLALAVQDGYHLARPVAILGFALFVSAMTLGRMVGPVVLDRFGRVRVLFGTAALAMVGVLLVVFGGSPWLAAPGILAWGVGASLGFPVGMSAAADDPARAPARVSVVATIGYVAFLAGPPAVGFVAGRSSTLTALLVVFAALLPAALAVPATRPLPDAGSATGRGTGSGTQPA